MLKVLNLIIGACLSFVIFNFEFIITPALAETLQSSSYKIRMGNFNITSGLKSSASYSLTDTVGQTAAGLYSSSGYSVKAGFQYIYTLYPFSFSIDDLTIDLATLTPNTLNTDSNILTVSAPGQGYTVSTYEVNRLKSGSNYIADTGCNSGTCTQSTAGVWTSTSALGFGYNATGDDIDSDFANSTYFRPFPDLSLGDSPEIVLTSSSAGQDRTSTITYQANIGGSQAAGDYSTQIIYIATPVY